MINPIDLDAVRRITQERVDRMTIDTRRSRARRRAGRRRWSSSVVSPTFPPAS